MYLALCVDGEQAAAPDSEQVRLGPLRLAVRRAVGGEAAAVLRHQVVPGDKIDSVVPVDTIKGLCTAWPRAAAPCTLVSPSPAAPCQHNSSGTLCKVSR